jgi:hypothetical protein
MSALVHLEQVDPGAVDPGADIERLDAARGVFEAEVRAEAERRKGRLLEGGVSAPAR